jgi:hypothetical protein
MIITQKTRNRLIGLLAVPLLAISVAACASGPSAGKGGDDAPGTSNAQQWALDFAKCMRDRGVEVEDPAAGGGTIATRPQDESPERQAATEVCIDELGPAPTSGGGQDGQSDEEQRRQMLAFAECLRERGFDVADPQPGTGLGMPDDVTDEAIEACGAFAPDSVPAG